MNFFKNMRKEYSKKWITAKQAESLSEKELERQFSLLGYKFQKDLSKQELIEFGYTNNLIVDFSNRGRKSKSITNDDILLFVRRQLKYINASDMINNKDITIVINKNILEQFLVNNK